MRGSEYREQGDGNFSQEVWRLVSVLIKDGHHQSVVNVFDRAAERQPGQTRFTRQHTDLCYVVVEGDIDLGGRESLS